MRTGSSAARLVLLEFLHQCVEPALQIKIVQALLFGRCREHFDQRIPFEIRAAGHPQPAVGELHAADEPDRALNVDGLAGAGEAQGGLLLHAGGLAGGQVQRGIRRGQRRRQVLPAAGIAHQPAEFHVLDGLGGTVAHLDARRARLIAGNLRPPIQRLQGRIGEIEESKLLGAHRAERGGGYGRRAHHAHVQLRPCRLAADALDHRLPQPIGTSLRQNVLEVFAVALRFQVPGGERAAGIQPVLADAGEILEQHTIQIDIHQRAAGHLRGTHQLHIDANRERFAGTDIEAGDGDRPFAADGDLLRDHAQRHAVDAAGAGVAQRERHVEIQHHGRAARTGVRIAGGHADQGDRRILAQVDTDAAFQRDVLRQSGTGAKQGQQRDTNLIRHRLCSPSRSRLPNPRNGPPPNPGRPPGK